MSITPIGSPVAVIYKPSWTGWIPTSCSAAVRTWHKYTTAVLVLSGESNLQLFFLGLSQLYHPPPFWLRLRGWLPSLYIRLRKDGGFNRVPFLQTDLTPLIVATSACPPVHTLHITTTMKSKRLRVCAKKYGLFKSFDVFPQQFQIAELQATCHVANLSVWQSSLRIHHLWAWGGQGPLSLPLTLYHSVSFVPSPALTKSASRIPFSLRL